jgi:hypothetical protein
VDIPPLVEREEMTSSVGKNCVRKMVQAQKHNIGYLHLQMVAMPYYLFIFNNILIGGTPCVTCMTMEIRHLCFMFL